MESRLALTLRSSDSGRPEPRCPGCRRAVFWQGNSHRPFCSITCRLIDLGVWLDEGYRIQGETAPADPPLDDRSAESDG